MQTFNELWEEAERTLQNETSISSSEEIIKDIESKITIYTIINKNASLNEEDKFRLKSHTFGKILLALTQLSAKDNVNVFTALKASLDEAKIEQLESIYK